MARQRELWGGPRKGGGVRRVPQRVVRTFAPKRDRPQHLQTRMNLATYQLLRAAAQHQRVSISLLVERLIAAHFAAQGHTPLQRPRKKGARDEDPAT